ncbi:hypothetical protein WJX74_004468 [Apatococcus lobatus]|uniref:Coiled-coil domain-containing protein 153 n=1 Tax=Apatococcus lobatus TaxID=904363 RepID=A0AAW1QVC0_9CHLO
MWAPNILLLIGGMRDIDIEWAVAGLSTACLPEFAPRAICLTVLLYGPVPDMPPKPKPKASAKQAIKPKDEGEALEQELQQEQRARAALLLKAEGARLEEQRWRHRVQAVSTVAQQQQTDALDVTAHLHRVLKDANAQYQQQLSELEAHQREMQEDLLQRDDFIQQLQDELQEQSAAAKKSALEYEQKIGAMNREFEKMLSLIMGKLRILLQNDEWMAIKARAAATKATAPDV